MHAAALPKLLNYRRWISTGRSLNFYNAFWRRDGGEGERKWRWDEGSVMNCKLPEKACADDNKNAVSSADDAGAN